jgi:hypothetical protein
MFFYLYQITNLVNNKIYIGVHATKDMNDGYMGSGINIQSAIKKYGIKNFNKVILFTFDNVEDMYAKEKEIVTEEFLLREDTYNLRIGGTGGFEYINKNNLKTDIRFNIETSMKLLKHLHKTYGDWKLVFGAYNTGRPMVNQYAIDVYNYKIR